MDKIPPLVFHADWFDIIEDLPQEQQLEVYRAIMLYAFRGEKSINSFARATTALMRKFIDSDRSKYEKAIQQRKEAIRKRWEKQKKSNTTEYDRTESNTTEYNTITITTNQDHNQDHNQDQQKEIDKSNSSATSISRTGANAAAPPEEDNSFRKKIAELKTNVIMLEQMAMKFHITTNDVCQRLDEFREDMELRGLQVRNPQSLFVTWLGNKMYGSKPKSRSSEPGLGIGEFRNSKGQRTYESSGVIVPDNAPPRPSAAHWWSEASRLWEKQI